ncbi:hypothetical protein GALL_418030 [mine drainage metagenome]|uniref:Uncharacterized protein n=1 Tax=mine drainage metagenome TaxID=410659 RepID=A0A1J5PZM0_9ZZZZ
MYTLSSPTAIAVDAACHPRARELLRAISEVFRLTETGVTQLGLYALDADPVATRLAWGMVELVDAATPSAPSLLAAAGHGGPLVAATLTRARLGDVRDVTRLVVTEAARWPDPPRVGVAGGVEAAASAAAAAGVVASWWTRPELPPQHAEVLARPWGEMRAHLDVLALEPDASYGPRGIAVTDLIAAVARGRASLTGLSQVSWQPGTWASSMHAAAWAAHRSGRLREQLLAVVDVTAALVSAHADATQLRAALPALHALAVAAVVGDVLEPEPLAALSRGAIAL